MRKLEELKLRRFFRPAPPCTVADVAWFEQRYGVKLPAAYVALLTFTNGGWPGVNRFLPAGSKDGEVFAVNAFYHLTPPHHAHEKANAGESVWRSTEALRPFLGPRAVPIASDGCGNEVYLDFRSDPPSVRLSVHDPDDDVLVADTFEKFLDLLHSD